MKINLFWKKETKNTHVYEDTSDEAFIPTLYIRKEAFKEHGEAPEEIQITVEFLE